MVEIKQTKLYNGDCIEVMQEIIDKGVKVDLTVTSPPYDNLRSYENEVSWGALVHPVVIKATNAFH